MNIVDRARRFVAKVNAAAVLLPDEEALTSVELFPKWEVGTIVESGLRVQYDVLLYRCVQSHTTQADWTPDITPALWVKVSIEEYPEWVQPTGGHDAYNIGDKVSFNGKKYESLINSNVYSPSAYPAGWKEL